MSSINTFIMAIGNCSYESVYMHVKKRTHTIHGIENVYCAVSRVIRYNVMVYLTHGVVPTGTKPHVNTCLHINKRPHGGATGPLRSMLVWLPGQQDTDGRSVVLFTTLESVNDFIIVGLH